MAVKQKTRHAHGPQGGRKAPAHEDYEALEQAVMATARGRWFLSEYLRRHQNDETRRLLKALRKLAGAASEPGQAPERAALEGMRLTLAKAADDIATLLRNDAACEPTLPEAAAGRLAELLAGVQRDDCLSAKEVIAVLARLFHDMARLLGEAMPRADAAPCPVGHEAEKAPSFPVHGQRNAKAASPQPVQSAVDAVTMASHAPSGQAAPSEDDAPAGNARPAKRITIHRQKDSTTVDIPLPETQQATKDDSSSRQDPEVSTTPPSPGKPLKVRIRRR